MNSFQIQRSLCQVWQEATPLPSKLFQKARQYFVRIPVASRLIWFLAICCGLSGCLGQEKTPLNLSVQKKIIPSSGGQFSMTFDDGPHPIHTPALLDWLKNHHIHATFFVLGENAERHPQIVERMVAEGHEVANHSWSHPNLRLMSNSRMLQQVRRTHDLIKKITGRAPVAFRPPYGSLNLRQKRLIEKEFGYEIVLWNVDTLDWKHRTSSKVADILRAEVKDRSIVLAHDIHSCILPALDQMLPYWQRAGLKPVMRPNQG